MKFTKEYIHIENDLKQTDQLLLNILSKADEPINTLTVQLLTAGGKRVRPLLYLVSSYFGDQDHPFTHQLAAIIELVHMSSLIHDDVVDQAPIRRGVPTIHTSHGYDIAIFTGNFLFAQALELLADVDDSRVHQIISKTLKKLTTGELEQLNSRYKVDHSIKKYLRRNRNKTARLIGISCQLGALINGASDELNERLYSIGYDIGMSYQIIDDVLDFTDQSEKFGKAMGQDLVEGHLTLPTILASKDKEFANQIENYFIQCKEGQIPDTEEIISEINQSDVLEQSDRYSQWYLRRALTNIKKLPDQTEKEILFQAIGFLMKRNY